MAIIIFIIITFIAHKQKRTPHPIGWGVLFLKNVKFE